MVLDDKCIVIGGGYSGLTMALYLSEQGFKDITLYDALEEGETLRRASMMTARNDLEIINLAKNIGCDYNHLFNKNINIGRWVNLFEARPDFVLDASVSDQNYFMGIINADSFNELILSALKSRGVKLNYSQRISVKDNRLVLEHTGEQIDQADYVFDATNFALIARSLKDRKGRLVLNDDPRVCQLLKLNIPAKMDPSLFIGSFGHSFGPFSWITPATTDLEGNVTSVDVVATRYCYQSEMDDQSWNILKKRIKNIIEFSSQRDEYKEAGLVFEKSHLDEKLDTGYYRKEPIGNIPLDVVPHIASKGFFVIGNGAGWGDPYSSNIFLMSIKYIAKLSELIKTKKAKKFHTWWTNHSGTNYRIAMANHHYQLRQKSEADREIGCRFLSITQEVLRNRADKTGDEGLFYKAVTQSQIAKIDLLNIGLRNPFYVMELVFKTYLPFNSGYLFYGGNPYGKKINSDKKTVILTKHGLKTLKTSNFGY